MNPYHHDPGHDIIRPGPENAVATGAAHAATGSADVGCGTGCFTRAMAGAVAPSGTALGVDPSIEAIAEPAVAPTGPTARSPRGSRWPSAPRRARTTSW
jgi:trans-aconitate methyltransferase